MNKSIYAILSKNRMIFILGLILLVIIALLKILSLRTDTMGLRSVVVSPHATTTSTNSVKEPIMYHYIEIIDGCGPYYNTGVCVNMRSGPGTKHSVVERLRTGIVLKVEDTPVENEGRTWYKIIFDKSIQYPERVSGDWYVASDPLSVKPFINDGDELVTASSSPTTKRIVVDRSEEMLYAYDGDVLFMKEPISTGLDGTPTPRGTFTVFKKTPSRYMQGPLPGSVSTQVYDLPGVPWNLYFTAEGAVIHGAYWHDKFGQEWSHGCVNLPSEKAKKLYLWADIGMKVRVQD